MCAELNTEQPIPVKVLMAQWASLSRVGNVLLMIQRSWVERWLGQTLSA